MFCSECGTKVNEGAKFCFNCGAKLATAIEGESLHRQTEDIIPKEFFSFIENKVIEAHCRKKRILPKSFYKRAEFYNVQQEQVDKIVVDYEMKTRKLESFIKNVYEENTSIELTEEDITEIFKFGNSLGLNEENIDVLMDLYFEKNNLEEKIKLYAAYIQNYIDNGSVCIEQDEESNDYYEEVFRLFERNILYMEKILKEQYEQSSVYELNEKQKEFVYYEGAKFFPEESISGIIYGFEKKFGVLAYKEEIEKQKALEKMEIFEVYGEKLAFSEEEWKGISVGRIYRKILESVTDNFISFYNDSDPIKDEHWNDLNKKVLYLLDAIYKGMVKSMEQKGVQEEDISQIEYMDVFQYWVPVFEEIDYKYNMICSGAEYAEYYRKLRKETRGRLVGGGFGLTGAMKGIATAEVINATVGVGHSAVNFLGNMRSQWKKISEIKELFGYSLKTQVIQVFEKTVQSAYATELRILEKYDENCKHYCLFYGKENSKVAEVYPGLLKENPFEKRLYEQLILAKGLDESIDKIAKYAGIIIDDIKEKYIRIEREARTEDGIVFSTMEEKEAYCKERNLFKPLLAEICQLNIYANQEQLEEKVELLQKVQSQAVKYWNEEVTDILNMCKEKKKGLLVPNANYLKIILSKMSVNVEAPAMVLEENIKYSYWAEYFNSVISMESDEKSVLFIMNSIKEIEQALILTTHHIYYYYKNKENEFDYMMFDFEQICDLRYRVDEKRKFISFFSILLSNKLSVDLWQLFNYENTSNYKYCKSFYDALKECIELGFKKNSIVRSNSIVKEVSNMSLKDKYDLAVCYLKGNNGYEKNEIIAVKLLEDLSIEEYADAQWSLGHYLYYCKLQESNVEEIKQKREKAVVLFFKAAQQGHAKALNMVATFYSTLGTDRHRRAKGIAKDDKKAVQLLKKAVEQDEPSARTNLAMHYFAGVGIEKNEQVGVRLLKESAEQGDIEAQIELAKCYQNGIGVRKSKEDAIYWYNEVAQKGNLHAKNCLREFKQRDIEKVLSRKVPKELNINVQRKENEEIIRDTSEKVSFDRALNVNQNSVKKNNENEKSLLDKYDLAVKYEEGKFIEKNLEKAIHIYRELAELGLPKAQWRLAECYNSGKGVTKNIKLAAELYEEAAKEGHIESMDALGYIYSSLGKKEWEVNDEKSCYWWYQAASQGSSYAQFSLSVFYYSVKKDHKQRVYWLSEAAKNNHKISQCVLAELYREGKIVEQDYEQAIYWYTKSAQNGYACAQYNLGACYANGIGVAKSKETAIYWFKEAAKQGYENADIAIKNLEGSGCYITTAVCESFNKPDDCYELSMFRRFRDEYLRNQDEGSELIQEYYSTAPCIVETINLLNNRKEIYEGIWSNYLMPCLKYIENMELERCKDLYIQMVYDLKEMYLK